MPHVEIKKSASSGCVISPATVKVRSGDTLTFKATKTKATVLIPDRSLTNDRVKDVPCTIQIKESLKVGTEYEYAVYGYECKDVRGRGRFGRGNSPPKIIIIT